VARPAIEIKGLTKNYPSFSLEDVSLLLPYGKVMGFLGNNGAGKSTTLKCIMGLLKPDHGEVWVDGHRVTLSQVEDKHQIGYVGEEPNFYDNVSVGWYAGFASQVYRVWDQEKFQKLCRAYSLDTQKKIKELSRGMKVKLGLALALAHNPKILILDEPTSGMDTASRQQLLAQLRLFVSSGDRAVLFSSHIISDIEKAADTVTIIKEGKVLLSQNKVDLLSDNQDSSPHPKDLERIFLDLVGSIDEEKPLEVIV
jgi:ABC-2 type transport system ATP-binding protein